MISRRKALIGLFVAPAIIRTPGLLMPIKPLVVSMGVPKRYLFDDIIVTIGTYDDANVANYLGKGRNVVATDVLKFSL